MPFFPCAHAGHPVWQHAVSQVIAQLRAQISMQKAETSSRLGVVYVSVIYAEHASDIVVMLSQALPGVQHWVGCAAHSVLAGDMDYGQTGALAVMLPGIAAEDYAVFSGLAPWRSGGLNAQSVLVHGDAASHKLAFHMQALHQQMGGAPGMVGGVCDLQTQHAQWSWGGNAVGHMPLSIGGAGVQVGGFSGVAFAEHVECLSVGMQGCKPVGSAYTVTQTDGDVVLALDGRPALEVFFNGVNWGDVLAQQHPNVEAVWQKVQQSLLAMTAPGAYVSATGLPADARVMRVVGMDPVRQGLVLAGMPVVGHTLTLCQADEPAMRTDMRRACAELWEALTTSVAHMGAETDAAAPNGRSVCGAIYIRSQHRHAMTRTPRVDAELQLIRHALGPVPLLGFTSTYEINAGALQHMSAQLLVFTQPLQALT